MKKKKLVLTMKIAVLLTMLLSSVSSFAGVTFTVDGLSYEVKNEEDKTVYVATPAEGVSYAGDIVIPATVDYTWKSSQNTDSLVTYSVVGIQSSAFDNRGTTSLSIPGGVKIIGVSAFANCDELTKVTFANIASICAMVFEDGQANPLSKDGVKLYVKNSANEDSLITELVIPDGVTEIKQLAFYGCKSITSVKIPQSVTQIRSHAFTDCTGLTKATFASAEALCGITFGNVDANPLWQAHHLYFSASEVAELTLPQIATIPKYAFAGCNNLKTVTIPKEVTFIDSDAFKDCTGLLQARYASLDHLTSVSYGSQEANPLNYAENLLLGSSSTSNDGITINKSTIPDASFPNCKWLKKLTIGPDVQSIGKAAFAGCTNLELVTIEEGSQLTSIGENAFRECVNLYSINLPESLTKIGELAFGGCKALSNVSLPSGFMSLGKQAFRDCWKIDKVVIPESTELGDYAFIYCTGLKEVTLPSALTTTPKGLFENCYNLQSVKYTGSGSGLQTVGPETFQNCRSLTTLPLPESVTAIGDYAFIGCTGFTHLVLPGNVISIGKSAFNGCSEVLDVTFPASITTIGDEAFSNCTKLKDVISKKPTAPTAFENTFGGSESQMVLHIPNADEPTYKSSAPWSNFSGKPVVIAKHKLSFFINDVLQEGEGKFFEQEEGTAINYDESVIVQLAAGQEFSGWNQPVPGTMPAEDTNLYGYIYENKTINGISYHLMPAEQINSLGYRAVVIDRIGGDYEGEISIPDSVSDKGAGLKYEVIAIDENAFAGDPITVLEFAENSKIIEIKSGAFMNCSGLQYIKKFPKGVTTINENLFSGCTSLGSFTIADGVTKIGKQAFRSCKQLGSITIPASATDLEQEIFYECSGLKKVTFDPKTNLDMLPERMFKYCSSLEEVALEGTITKIGMGAFMSCGSLESIVIPEGTYQIYSEAFSGCGKLASVSLPKTLTYMAASAFAGCQKVEYITASRAEAPVIEENTFDSYIFDKASLYVPEEATGYDAGVWGEFKKETLKKFKLLYILDGNEYAKDSVWVGTKLEQIAEPKDLKKTEREFSGWQGLPAVMPYEDVTVIGAFKYQLSYDFAEGSLKESKDGKKFTLPEAEDHFYGEKLTVPTSLHQENFIYEFVDGETVISMPETMPAKDSVMYVNYKLSEQETTDEQGVNYKVFVLADSAVVIASPNVSGNIVLPKDITYGTKSYKVVAIQDNAFYGNRLVKSMTLGANLKRIGRQAFRDCRFSSIKIPASVDSIADYAFLYCTVLNSVEFEENSKVKRLSESVFQNCLDLSTIKLPQNLETICSSAFNSCSKLKGIVLPESVKKLEDYAFSGCAAMDSVVIKSTTLPEASAVVFVDDVYDNATLYLLEGTTVSQSTPCWGLFKHPQIGEVVVPTEYCAKPTISYNKGKLEFACATADANIFTDITSEDVKTHPGKSVALTKTYIITARAEKSGLLTSAKATATITWHNGKPDFEGFKSVKLEDSNILKGDVNDDGKVSITDAVSVVNIILNQESAANNVELSDEEDADEKQVTGSQSTDSQDTPKQSSESKGTIRQDNDSQEAETLEIILD